MIPVTLIKVYIEKDDHAIDIEMFRVFKHVTLIIEPQENTTIILKKSGNFYINKIEQNLEENEVYIYEYTEIPYYEFWSKREKFRKKYLPPLLNEGWCEI